MYTSDEGWQRLRSAALPSRARRRQAKGLSGAPDGLLRLLRVHRPGPVEERLPHGVSTDSPGIFDGVSRLDACVEASAIPAAAAVTNRHEGEDRR